MMIESIHQGVELQDVLHNTGFRPIISGSVKTTPPPSDTELRVLREEVDPGKYILGRQ